MKPELKYIRIYEAFESEILGKTLAFINKDSQSTFLSHLKDITSSLDMPLSRLSDEQFQYLPFKRALNLNTTLEDDPCDATSGTAFPKYEVPGETCNGGMSKRKWGQSTRMVSCPICGGTGVKKRNNIEMKWVKFWFSKDGVFVTMTGTDGEIRDQYSGVGKAEIFSRNESDYVLDRTVRRNGEEVRSLVTGDIVKINIGRSCIGMIWAEGNRRYVLQDVQGGGQPTGSEWAKFARYSWEITQLDFNGSISLLRKKDKPKEKEKEEEVNPYTWNALANFRYGSFNLRNFPDMEQQLKDAHFALVLDWQELKNIASTSEEKTLSTIKTERDVRKKDVLALKTDDEIRKANISRYIQSISDRINVTDLKDLPKHLVRLFGWNSCGIYILSGRNFDAFSTVISIISKFLKSNEEEDKTYYLEQVKNLLRKTNRTNLEFNELVNTKLREAYKNLQDSNRDQYTPILDKYFEFNKAIMDKFFKDKSVDCIEDLDTLYAKINSIRTLINNSSRYSNIKQSNVYFDNITRSDSWTLLYRYVEPSSINDTLSEFDSIIKVIQRM